MKIQLFILLLLAAAYANGVAEAVNETAEGTRGIEAGTPLYETGIVKDWQALSFMLALITIFLVAGARMLADPLNLPELKAWANVEWSQAFVTVAIVAFTIVTLEFIDTVVMEQVNNSPGSPVTCSSSDFCLYNVSNAYLDDLINLSKESARESFTKAIESGKASSYKMSLSCDTLLIPPCLWFSYGWGNNAFLILDVERSNQELEQYGNIIYSLSVQKFFVNNVNYYVGPSLLLIGIVARSFFLTRRAGGLMMATAMGIMFVFPMMYLWNMITLNVTVYGDKLFEEGGDCPPECGYKPSNKAPCNSSVYDDCPSGCRELPYPYIIANCSEPATELACMDVPLNCKVVRTTSAASDCDLCPMECRITAPLDGTDNCEKCFVSTSSDDPESIPFSCRVALRKTITNKDGTGYNDMGGRIEQCLVETPQSIIDTYGEDYKNTYAEATRNCPANNTDAYKNCMYVVPDIPDCECTNKSCCINAPNSTCKSYSVTTTYSVYGTDGTYGGEASNTTILYNCASGQENTCLNYTGARFWNNNTETCTCIGSGCKSPAQTCNGCFNVSNEYCLFGNGTAQNPHVNPDCPGECSETGMEKPALLTAGEFVKKSGEGMYGREDIKNVSKFLLPAYLLPLMNIVVTLMFIRGFSPIFGGDVDLPGWAKVL